MSHPILSADEIEAIRSDGPFARPLPARCYSSQAIFEFEMDHIVRKNWMMVGRWDQVEKPGDYFTTQLAGEPLIIVRDKKGELHALSNSCRHRNAAVAQDSGNASLFMCPYHRWTYNLDGSLRGLTEGAIPGFDPKQCHLPRHQIEVWQGFIFVNLDPQAPPLGPQLTTLTAIVEPYRLSEYRLIKSYSYDAPYNWKVAIENGAEAYHHLGPHFESTQHLMPAGNMRSQPTDGPYYVYRVPFTEGADQVFRPFGVPPQAPQDDNSILFFGVFPSLTMFCDWTQAGFILFEPQSAGLNRASTILLLPPFSLEHEHGEAYKEESIGAMVAIQDEDTAVCQEVQKGMNSLYGGQGVMHPLERGTLQPFHKWIVDQYQRGGNAL